MKETRCMRRGNTTRSHNMVATAVLDEALRGGEPARKLEARAHARLRAAEAALAAALPTAPAFIAETRAASQVRADEAHALLTELDMISESLDDIAASGAKLVEKATEDLAREEALRDLSLALPPFVQVADALNATDGVEGLSFDQLQKCLATLEAAIVVAQASSAPVLRRAVPELEERAYEATAMMKARYMDTFEVRSQSIVARSRSQQGSVSHLVAVGAPSVALAKAGLLKDAIEGIVSELVRNNVADGLRAATVFFESNAGSGSALEWTVGSEGSGELLEFDLDDLDDVPDADIDAMTDALDIANAASRALKVFDLFRENVVGIDHSRDLANALRGWFADAILPAAGVVKSMRTCYAESGVPRDALRVRALATSAAARVLQAAVRARGATSFELVVDTDALEATVGAECRGEAVFAARRAIATFADARHDEAEMAPCPIASAAFIPRPQRPPEYFAPCLVSQAASIVLGVFRATRADALEALTGGSTGIGNALNAAAVECIRAYQEDVPVQHGDDLRASLRLKALYYNDCMMLAHACRVSAQNSTAGASAEVLKAAVGLERAAHNAMMVVRRTAEQRLMENLNAACRNGALGAYGTLTRIQRGSALSAAFNAMREVVSVFAQIVPTELAELAAATLLDKYLTRLCNEVVLLPEISADGCDQIDAILVDADKNVNNLMDLVKGMNFVRAGAPPPEMVSKMRNTQRRLHAIREILSARMEDIVTAYREGKYDTLIDRQAVEHFILAIFEDTPLRASFIADLDVSLEAESGEWSNSNW